MADLNSLFAHHAARSFAKQLALQDYLGEHAWNVDITRSIVDFGNGRIHPIQLIGTESEGDGCFMWAWANTASKLPPASIRGVESLRAWGQKNGVAELSERKLPLDQWPGHNLAMVAAGLLNADAYYRGPYDGGALYFLVLKLPPLSPIPTERILTVLTQTISQWDIDGRTMTEAFLEQEGFTLACTDVPGGGGQLHAVHADGRALDIDFDGLRRIVKLSGTVGPKLPN